MRVSFTLNIISTARGSGGDMVGGIPDGVSGVEHVLLVDLCTFLLTELPRGLT